MTAGVAAAGPAWCAQALPDDNLAAHLAVSSAPPGAVIVLDASMDRTHAYWGELLTVAAIERGIAGLAVAGCIRDTARIRALGFPVFALGSCPVGPSAKGHGNISATVTVDGIPVHRGDWIVGDDDGLIRLARGSEVDAVNDAEARLQHEAGAIDELRAGRTTLEIFDLG